MACALCVALLAASASASPSGAGMQVLDTIGTGALQLSFGVAVEPTGEIYVTDAASGKVEAYDAGGGPRAEWDAAAADAAAAREGGFVSPSGIAYYERSAEVWVADADGQRLICYDAKGRLDRPPMNHFEHPMGLAVDGEENVYVAADGWNVVKKDPSDVRSWNTQWGQALGEFMYPQGVAMGPDGLVYVADLLNKRIQKLTTQGRAIGQISVTDVDGTPLGPGGIAIDTATTPTTLLVAIEGRGIVQRYTLDGVRLGQFGDGILDHPWGVGVADDGTVTVADAYHHRLVRFRDDGS